MKTDLRTVIWKETRSLFRQRGSRTRALLTLLTPVAFFSVYGPWSMGRDWATDPLSIIAAVITPMLIVTLVIPDSIAGERERHTLPTLLASRLPDRAILFGKALHAVGVAWAVTLVTLLLGLVTVNVVHWDGRVLFYDPTVLGAVVSLSLLTAVLATGVGVFISLRAKTVQEAQQLLAAAVLGPITLLGPVVLVLSEATDLSLIDKVASLDGEMLLAGTVAVLLAIDAMLVFLAVRRFQRPRLIGDR
jgi:ABC-2 type transport system permease protein